MSKQTIQDRIQLLVDQAGNPNAFSKVTGISVSGIRRYLIGGEPTASKIMVMAEASNVSPAWLLTGEGEEGSCSDRPSHEQDVITLNMNSSIQISIGVV